MFPWNGGNGRPSWSIMPPSDPAARPERADGPRLVRPREPRGMDGPQTEAAAGIAWEDLPQVDAVLVSHDHYDHFDAPTLKRLEERFHPVFLVPLGLRRLLLRPCGAQAQIRELDWWQSATCRPGMGKPPSPSPPHGITAAAVHSTETPTGPCGEAFSCARRTVRAFILPEIRPGHAFSRKYGTASALRTWPFFPSGPIFRKNSWQASICRRATQSGPLKRCAPGRAWPSTSAPGNWRTTATRKRWTISGSPSPGRRGGSILHCRGQRVYAPIKWRTQSPAASIRTRHPARIPRRGSSSLNSRKPVPGKTPPTQANTAITGMEHKPASHARMPHALVLPVSLLPAIWTGRLSSPRPHPAEHGPPATFRAPA